MRRTFIWLVLPLLIHSLGLHAEELRLEYDVVVHVTDVHALPVPASDGHQVGVASFKGMAIFKDGRIANHRYAGHFDFVDGAGHFSGYAVWVFDDGSMLRSRYTGKASATDDGKGIRFEGEHGTPADADLGEATIRDLCTSQTEPAN